MKPKKETKEEKFQRLAEARVNKIIAMLRLLGNLSYTGIYAYTRDDVEKIFTRLQIDLIKAKMRFLQPEKSRRQRFSLSKPYRVEESENEVLQPTIAFLLPDGSYLRAVGYPHNDYPCIDIYWDNGVNDPTYPICFAEFNSDKPDGQQVCIGAYCSTEEDTQYSGFNLDKPFWEQYVRHQTTLLAVLARMGESK